MAKAQRIIDRLTEEQFRIIEFLRGHRRARIQGCAGSGKTLVAVEKAIRLDHAGLRVLLLCHNRNLSAQLRFLCSGTGIEVYDFRSWMQAFGACLWMNSEWHVHEEPTDEDLALALDELSRSSTKYDAVIVDEGQDFRGSWWPLVEAAMHSPQAAMLYVFFDNHQTFLPHRELPSIPHVPYVLSRNCRNAGAVFDLVRRICPNAPEPSHQLANLGTLKLWRYGAFEDAKKNVALALGDALNALSSERIVVLTTEPDPVDGSILNGMRFARTAPWRWQSSITAYVKLISNAFSRGPRFEYPKLSKAPVPLDSDVTSVYECMQSIVLEPGLATAARLFKSRLQWRVEGGSLSLNVSKRGKVGVASVWSFLQQPEWADGIRALQSVRVLGPKPDEAQEPSDVPLYTVTSFKGLEADGVILLISPHATTLPKLDGSWCSVGTYVGVSRARFLLHVVASTDSKEANLAKATLKR